MLNTHNPLSHIKRPTEPRKRTRWPLISQYSRRVIFSFLLNFNFSVNRVRDKDWFDNAQLIVAYDGGIMWRLQGAFETSCTLKMANFPFDEQKCSLNLSTQISTLEVVDLYIGTAKWANLSGNGNGKTIAHFCYML